MSTEQRDATPRTCYRCRKTIKPGVNEPYDGIWSDGFCSAKCRIEQARDDSETE